MGKKRTYHSKKGRLKFGGVCIGTPRTTPRPPQTPLPGTQLLYTMKPWSHRIDDGRQNSFNGRMNLINLAHVNNYLKQIT